MAARPRPARLTVLAGRTAAAPLAAEAAAVARIVAVGAGALAADVPDEVVPLLADRVRVNAALLCRLTDRLADAVLDTAGDAGADGRDGGGAGQ